MAWRVKSCDCDCERQIDACNCPPASWSLECQTKTGTATLCGIDEFNNINGVGPKSVPPRRYRRIEYSGNPSRRQHGGDGTCVAVVGTDRDGWWGYVQYNPSTCVPVYASGYPTASGCNPDNPPSGSCDLSSCVCFLRSPAYVIEQADRTRIVFRLNNTNCYSSDGFTFFSMSGTGDTRMVHQLSDEDTEVDAMARHTATWTSFAPVTDLPSCSGWVAARGANQYSFSYREARWRITVTGDRDRLYTLKITYGRRPQGSSGKFTKWLVQPHTISTGFDKRSISEGLIPQESGYGFETAIVAIDVEDYLG